jgi:hypothetical protein
MDAIKALLASKHYLKCFHTTYKIVTSHTNTPYVTAFNFPVKILSFLQSIQIFNRITECFNAMAAKVYLCREHTIHCQTFFYRKNTATVLVE